jgi:hypothetical protein
MNSFAVSAGLRLLLWDSNEILTVFNQTDLVRISGYKKSLIPSRGTLS